jgi:cation/acetate symporter
VELLDKRGRDCTKLRTTRGILLVWKRTTKEGIAAAVAVGMLSSLGWILLSGQTYANVYGLEASASPVPFSQPALVTIPLGFAVLIVVSLLTPAKEAKGESVA